MKIRRITLEIEVPYKIKANTVLVLASGMLNQANIRNQGRVVASLVSPNITLPEVVVSKDEQI